MHSSTNKFPSRKRKEVVEQFLIVFGLKRSLQQLNSVLNILQLQPRVRMEIQAMKMGQKMMISNRISNQIHPNILSNSLSTRK